MDLNLFEIASNFPPKWKPVMRQAIERVLDIDPTAVPQDGDWLGSEISAKRVGVSSVDIWRSLPDEFKRDLLSGLFERNMPHKRYIVPMDRNTLRYYGTILFCRIINGILTPEELKGKRVIDYTGRCFYMGPLPDAILSDAKRLFGELVTESTQAMQYFSVRDLIDDVVQ